MTETGKRKRGRPPRNKPKYIPGDGEIIQEMAAKGATQNLIAMAFDVAPSTIDDWIAHRPEVRRGWLKGHCEYLMAITETAKELALAGDTTMLIFLLKTRVGYKESKDGMASLEPPTVHIYMPDNGRENSSTNINNSDVREE